MITIGDSIRVSVLGFEDAQGAVGNRRAERCKAYIARRYTSRIQEVNRGAQRQKAT
jgi:hypothetical protein